jgi:putative tryptophan/tyrosine transport system substrate-binding protein
MVSEMVNLKPDAIFVTSTRLLFMLKGATTTIPLVGLMGDPIRFGLVASMARPGGNITGVSVDPGMEFYDKRYQLLKEAVPKVAKLGILISRVFLEKTADGAAMREAARRAGIDPPSKRLTGERRSIGARSREWQKKALMGSSWLQWSKIGHTAD